MSTIKDIKRGFFANETKWSKPVIEASGFTVIPSIILEHQDDLNLNSTDINVILHLAKHWWAAENPPHPSKKSIAKSMGVTTSTVQRSVAKMEREGLIQREKRYQANGGQQTNLYHFDGLIDRITPYAEEVISSKREKNK